MAFSATPADFGALLIQRRRWANGGLLIVPKLWHFLWTREGRRAGVSEVLLRLHYLTSLAVANVALLLLLGLAFDARLASMWLPITAAPYTSSMRSISGASATGGATCFVCMR
jgi:cellulose synthase/poly-beta-1,6-N-acetylglucosamine synthase-like glycosyltransferase